MPCYAMVAGSETSLPNPIRVALRCNGYKCPVNPPQGLLRDASARRAIPQQRNCLKPHIHRQHHRKKQWHPETNTSDPGKGRYAMLPLNPRKGCGAHPMLQETRSNTPIANNYLREECQKDYLHIARGVVPEVFPLLRTANCERSFARRLTF